MQRPRSGTGVGIRIVWLAVTLAAAMLAGWAGAAVADRHALASLIERTRSDAVLRAALLDSEIARYRLLPLVLADEGDILAAIDAPGADLTGLDRRLERLAATTDAPVIYVIGRDGRAIASSNWSTPQSFVGRPYGFRRYVIDALAHGQAAQFALGTMSNRPGLYLTSRTGNGGVVVIKLEFDRIEAEWRAAGGITLIRGPDGVVLVSSRDDWRYGMTGPLDAAGQHRFADAARLPVAALHRLDVTALDGIAHPGRQRFVAASVATAQPGWRLTELNDPGPALQGATHPVAIAAALAVIAASSLLWMVRERRVRRRRDRTALERAVADRTAELREEMAGRAASEKVAADLRERLRQANRLAALGQITAALAHETAQPVGAIRTYCRTGEMLLDRGETAPARQTFAAIAGLAERLGSLTAELRGFARRGPDPLGRVRLADIVAGALLILRERLDGIELSVPPIPPELMVQGSLVRLEQVVVNLLANAIEALRELRGDLGGHIAIDFAAGADEICLGITDDGPGIAADIAARLFAPFATSRPDGLGLGLVISQDIMAECGGLLRQVDRAGGARFEMVMRRA